MFLKSRDNKTNKLKRNHTLPSIISSDALFCGDIMSQGEIQVEGKIIGDIRAKILTIHANAQIKGNVIAEMLDIHGHIIGNVHAHKVHMFTQSRIEGNVTHEHISIEAGAFINGKCQHETFMPPEPPDLKDKKSQKSEKTDSATDNANVYQYPAHGQDVA